MVSSWVGSAGVFEIASHTVAITDSRVQVGLVTCGWEGASHFAWHLIRHTLKSHQETISVWPGARPCSPALPCASIPRWTKSANAVRPAAKGKAFFAVLFLLPFCKLSPMPPGVTSLAGSSHPPRPPLLQQRLGLWPRRPAPDEGEEANSRRYRWACCWSRSRSPRDSRSAITRPGGISTRARRWRSGAI